MLVPFTVNVCCGRVLVHQVERVVRGGRDARGREGRCSACRPRSSSWGSRRSGRSGRSSCRRRRATARLTTTARSTIRRIRAGSLRDAVIRSATVGSRRGPGSRAAGRVPRPDLARGRGDDRRAIDALCARAAASPCRASRRSHVAAVCVWPRLAVDGPRAARGDIGRASPARPAGSRCRTRRSPTGSDEIEDAGSTPAPTRSTCRQPVPDRRARRAPRLSSMPRVPPPAIARVEGDRRDRRAAARRDPLPRRRRDRGGSRLREVLHRQGRSRG